MRATVWDVWSPGKIPLRGDRLGVVVGVGVGHMDESGDVLRELSSGVFYREL